MARHVGRHLEEISLFVIRGWWVSSEAAEGEDNAAGLAKNNSSRGSSLNGSHDLSQFTEPDLSIKDFEDRHIIEQPQGSPDCEPRKFKVETATDDNMTTYDAGHIGIRREGLERGSYGLAPAQVDGTNKMGMESNSDRAPRLPSVDLSNPKTPLLSSEEFYQNMVNYSRLFKCDKTMAYLILIHLGPTTTNLLHLL